MKKEALVSIIAALSLMSQSAMAEIGTVSCENWENGEYRVQGYFNNGGKAAIEVLKPSKTVNDDDAYSYVGEAEVGDDGKFDSTFTLNGASGEYLIRVGLGGQVFEKKFTFINKAEYDVYKKMLKDASTWDDVRIAFEKDYGKLKAMCNLSVDAEDKERVYKTIKEAVAKADIETPEKLKAIIAEVVLLESFMGDDERPQDSLANLLDSFDDKYLPVVELWKNSSLTNDSVRDEIIKNLKREIISSFSEFQEAFCENVIFENLASAESKGKEIQILELVNTLMPVNEYDYFEALSQSKKISILQGMKSGFSSVADYSQRFDAAVNYSRKNPGSSSSGGTSSSGTKNSSSGTFIKVDGSTNQPTTPEQPEKIDGFIDLENFAWAKASIMNLYNKKVIQGKENGIFAPSDNVKREEFASMVVKALELYNENAECDVFEDVKPDDWYYEAVATAFEKEIIKGISETAFGSGLMITRQDAVVICKNAAQAMGVSFNSGEEEEGWAGTNYEYAAREEDAFSDTEDIADYAKESIEALNAAGVVNGMSDGTFKPKENMTRAQSAVMIERLMNFIAEVKSENNNKDLEMVKMLESFGMYDGDTKSLNKNVTRKEAAKLVAQMMNITAEGEETFTDCANDEYLQYIKAVNAMKLITGENGAFRPDEELGFDTAASVVVKALGYDAQALADGGFPSGYLKTAESKGLLSGVEKSGTNSITKINLLKMFVNAFDKEVLEMEYSPNGMSLTSDGGVTFINAYAKLYKDRGQITSNHDIALGGTEKTGINEITISGHTMVNNNPEYDALMGYDVTYYYKEIDGEDELVYAASRNKTKALTLTDADIEDFSNMKYLYMTDDMSREKTIAITNSVNVVYNGQTVYDYNSSQLNPKSGTVTFVDSNGDGKYDENDVLIITEYKNIIVGSKDMTKEVIFDKYREDYSLNLSEFEEVTIEDKDGKTYGLRELREWDVLSAIITPDGKKAYLYLCDNYVKGVCSSLDKADNTIRIEDKEFKLTGDFPDIWSDIKTGKTVTLYLDKEGRVAAVKAGTVTEDTNSETTAIAVLTKYGLDEDSSDEVYYIKVYGSDKKITYKELEEKISFNGKRVKSSDIAGYMDEQVNKALLLGYTAEGKVNSITTAAALGEDDNRGFWRLNNEGERLIYGSEASHFGKKFRVGGTVYTVPQDSENIGNVDYYAYNTASFVNDTAYVLDGYTTNINSRVASVIVYKAKAEKAGNYNAISGFVIASVEDRLDADDNVYKYMEGINYIEKVDYGTPKGFEIDQDVMIIDATGKEKKITENGVTRNMTVDDLEAGDCIRYSESNGKIVSIQLTYDYSEDTLDSAGQGDNNYYNAVIQRAAHAYGGWAYQVTDNGEGLVLAIGKRPEEIDLSKASDVDALKYYWIRSPMVTVVDNSGRKPVVRKGTMDDIMTYNQTKSSSGYSKVVMFSEWGASIYGVVVYIE